MADTKNLNVKVSLQDNASKGLSKLDGNVNNVEKSFLSLGKVAGVAGAAALFTFGKSALNAAAQYEQSQIAFETMLGSAEKGNKLLQELADFAQKTPFELVGIESNAKQLLAMGIEAEDLMPTLKSLGDVSAGLSVPLERLALNYGQVATQGKLTGKELRDFAVAGVPLLAQLGTQLNKSKEEITKMVSAGEIGFDKVETAFQDMTSEGGIFADLMDKQSRTYTGMVSNLADAWGLFLRGEGKKFIEWSKSVVQWMIDFVENDAPKVVDAVTSFAKPFVVLGKVSIETLKKINEFAGGLVTLESTIMLVTVALYGMMGKAVIAGFTSFFGTVAVGSTASVISLNSVAAAATKVKVAILALPISWTIVAALVGGALVLNQINKLKEALNVAQDAQTSLQDNAATNMDREVKRIQKLKAKNRELAKDGTRNAHLIEANNKIIDTSNIKLAISTIASQKAALESERLTNNFITDTFGKKRETIDRQIKSLNLLESTESQKLRSIRQSWGDTAVSVNNDLLLMEKAVSESGGFGFGEDPKQPKVPTGGGGAAKAIKDFAIEEAKAIAKAIAEFNKLKEKTEDIGKSYADFRDKASLNLNELEKDHSNNVAKIKSNIDELQQSLKDLQESFNINIQEVDTSTGERVLEQRQKIKDVEQNIIDAKEEQRKLSFEVASDREGEKELQLKKQNAEKKIALLEENLSKEKVSLELFLKDNIDIQDEIVEAERRASMTSFDRFIEDQNKRKEELTLQFEDKKQKINDDLIVQRDAQVQEEEIFNKKKEVLDRTQLAYNNFFRNYENGIKNMADITSGRVDSMIIDFERLSKVSSSGDNLTSNIDIGARANGGSVSSGSPYLVGERGPELFVPGSSGTVVPNKSLGQSTSIVLNGIFGKDAAEEIGDMIVKKLGLNTAMA